MYGMDDERLDQLLEDASRRYHHPPPAPLDAMWDHVAESVFVPVATRRRLPWNMIGVAAAALVVGVFAGRMSVGGSAAGVSSHPAPLASAVPASRATERYLGQTAVLLAA